MACLSSNRLHPPWAADETAVHLCNHADDMGLPYKTNSAASAGSRSGDPAGSNPTQSIIHFVSSSSSNSGPVQIEIFDLSGRVMLKKEFQTKDNVFVDLSNLIAGIYFYSFSNATGRFCGKIEKF